MSQNPTDHTTSSPQFNLEDFEVEILYEDNHLIAVNKPFGMLSQGDETGDISIFDWTKEYIRQKYNKPGQVYLGLLHRLDRPVGGVMLFAKTSKAAKRVSESFRKREVQKVYLAVTEGVPSPAAGKLTHHLKQLDGKNIIRAHNKAVQGSKPSELEYRVLKSKKSQSLVEILPLTGRKHQIRVQLASLGTVIKGDVKYGNTSFNPDRSISLFAKSLSLNHPVKDKGLLKIEAAIPQLPEWQAFT